VVPYHLGVIPIETARLELCHLTDADAPFILELLNEPSFLRFIGDKGVRTLEDAREYIRKGPADSYERRGFGLYLTRLKDAEVSIGICGLVKRDALEDVDIGFAFLPRFWSQGYAFESASAVLKYGHEVIGLKRIVAITNPDNESSIRLLEKLGLRFDRLIQLPDNAGENKLFVPEPTK
jgi:ribosomal-protein-alanine N-acetyltransferase